MVINFLIKVIYHLKKHEITMSKKNYRKIKYVVHSAKGNFLTLTMTCQIKRFALLIFALIFHQPIFTPKSSPYLIDVTEIILKLERFSGLDAQLTKLRTMPGKGYSSKLTDLNQVSGKFQ